MIGGDFDEKQMILTSYGEFRVLFFFFYEVLCLKK